MRHFLWQDQSLPRIRLEDLMYPFFQLTSGRLCHSCLIGAWYSAASPASWSNTSGVKCPALNLSCVLIIPPEVEVILFLTCCFLTRGPGKNTDKFYFCVWSLFFFIFSWACRITNNSKNSLSPTSLHLHHGGGGQWLLLGIWGITSIVLPRVARWPGKPGKPGKAWKTAKIKN